MSKLVHQLVQKGFRYHLFVLMFLFLTLSLVPNAVLGITLSGKSEMNVLGVAAGPDFSKSFIPSTIGPGSESTLRFDINNTSSSPVTELAFTDNMPAGVVIATPANVSNSCNGTLTAPDGGNSISLVDGDVGGSSSCVITVDVTSSTIGTHTNTSGALTSAAGTGNAPSADLTVDINRPGFSKSFSPSVVDFRGRSTLIFTIDNTANEGAIGKLSFPDNLPAGMEIADPANASTTCGTEPLVPEIIAVPGTAIFSFFLSGSVPDAPGVGGSAACIVSVDIVATGTGMLNNSSGELTINGTDSSGKANATLESSSNSLYLTKEFVADPVPAGTEVDLVFTIENQDRLNSATSVDFTDDLDATLSGLAPVSLSPTACGGGALSFTGGVLSLVGGSLASSSSCTFTTTLQVPSDAAAGSYPNITSDVTAVIGSSPVVGTSGSDTLFIAPVPLLTKTFIDDPVASGDDVTLQFNITNSSATFTATDISFIDELTTFLPFPVTAILPATPCGAGSTITLTVPDVEQALALAGGNLAPNASCTFSVTITIPVGLGSGSYQNTTSNVTATVDGESLEGYPATDTLEVVSAPTLRKSFTDDPVLAGDLVTLEFTIEHGIEEPGDATNIVFSDDLDAVLNGLVAVGLPQNNVCGSGSQISGTDTLNFTGGSLIPGEICTFSVQLQIPSGELLPGNHPNSTSNVTADVLGLAVTGLPAEDDLIIGGLTFTKSFTDDPVIPGDTVTLEFRIENESTTQTTTAILFTDSLSSVLSGLVAVGLPQNDICGSGSQINGTSSLSFAGGSLAPQTSCTFSVTLQVPAGSTNDTYFNTTSNLTANIDGNGITLDPATDGLVVNSNLIALTKHYVESPVLPGDTATLQFTLENLHQSTVATTIAFTDDLGASLSGLVAIPPLPSTPCGAGSQISGSDELLFTGGTLSAGEVCTFNITVQVPGTVSLGDRYDNITTDVTAIIDGFDVTGDPGQDTLVIGIPPVYLPIVLNDALFAPDLVVTSLDVGGGNVQIVLTNQGSTAVNESFWVDLYINPNTVPTMVNQTWPLVGSYGAVWGIEGGVLPLNVGESITLTLNDTYYYPGLSNLPASISAGTPAYVQVDSANAATTYGGVLETHEITNGSYNNIFGPVSASN